MSGLYWLRFIARTFAQGLSVVLPAALTLWILIWLARTAEQIAADLSSLVFGEAVRAPGVGILVMLIVVFLAGLLLHAAMVRQVWRSIERRLETVSLLKTVYGSIKDLFSYFSRSKEDGFDQVVFVRLGNQSARIVGFVTRDDLKDLEGFPSEGDPVAVYLPMSYQVGGFTILVPRADVEPAALDFESALRFVLTAGVTGSASETSPDAAR